MKNYKLQSKTTGETFFAGFYKNYKTCLEEAVKRHIPLHNIDLRNRNLCNANLDDGIFGYADFSGSNLTGANMSECYLKEANFQNTSLFNTCFAHSNITNCNFQDASFGATDIAGAIIYNCTFSTLSSFSLDFNQARQIENCVFISEHGQISRISRPPIVVSGLNNSPIIILDDQIFEGHTPITLQKSKTLLAQIKENMEK